MNYLHAIIVTGM